STASGCNSERRERGHNEVFPHRELDLLPKQELRGRRKSGPQKIRIAARLWPETTMTLEWIAKRLCMGPAPHVASLLQRQSQKAQNSEKNFVLPRLRLRRRTTRPSHPVALLGSGVELQ